MSSSSSAADAEPTRITARKRQILPAEIRLLYSNSTVGVGVNLIASTILCALQWDVVSRPIVVGWWLYMLLISSARFLLARRYWASQVDADHARRWGAAFSAGAGLAGAGWGAAGILLYTEAHLTNQVFLVFVLGGMMLGAAPVLAARPEAFLAFLIPAGLAPGLRLLLAGDQTHAAMGLLAVVFTMATVVTTRHIHRTIESSLALQFENHDLVEELKVANSKTEALNQQLEKRVEERTAELHLTNERLRAEVLQREQMEEELLRVRKLEAVGVLAGGIAHDFNNFLTVILGHVEIIRLHLQSGEPVDQSLERIASACLRATFLSTQLLTFAKGGTPVRHVASVAKLVKDAVNLARAGSAISFDVEIAEDLWCAEVDPNQIGQVLHNILLNARQAMPEAGGIIEVRAENVLDNRLEGELGVRLSIRDYGCGIPADVLPRVFDPYFTTKSTGNGLGLATTYAIVNKHGGRIDVESKLGHGTVFTVDLPATRERPAPEPPAVAPSRGGQERLLAMDDDEALRKLLQGVLTRLGYQVESAGDGAEAVALYEAARASGRPFDAVLLDLTVSGGMGGVEAAAKIREIDSSAKLIVSSGYSDSEAMSNFRAYGFDDVIPKPWSAAELVVVLRRVLAPDANRQEFSRVAAPDHVTKEVLDEEDRPL